LRREIPVRLGVDHSIGSPHVDTGKSTDYFIVIVGVGKDADGSFFTFLDKGPDWIQKAQVQKGKN
jgi:hypothetical protein